MTAVEVLLVYSKVCIRCLSQMLTCIKRGKESIHHWYFAPMRKTGGDGLLSQISMGDENRVHHFDPILNLQFTKWQTKRHTKWEDIQECAISREKILQSCIVKKIVIFVNFLLNRDYNELWLLSWSINWSPSSSSSHKKNISIVGPLQV